MPGLQAHCPDHLVLEAVRNGAAPHLLLPTADCYITTAAAGSSEARAIAISALEQAVAECGSICEKWLPFHFAAQRHREVIYLLSPSHFYRAFIGSLLRCPAQYARERRVCPSVNSHFSRCCCGMPSERPSVSSVIIAREAPYAQSMLPLASPWLLTDTASLC